MSATSAILRSKKFVMSGVVAVEKCTALIAGMSTKTYVNGWIVLSRIRSVFALFLLTLTPVFV